MESHSRRQQGCICQKYADAISRIAYLEEQLKMEKEENYRLRNELGRVKRTAREQPFGLSTPSSKKLVKPSAGNPASEAEAKRRMGGAKHGHKGHGWKNFDLEVEEAYIPPPDKCPGCGGSLEPMPFKDMESRDVVELRPVKGYVRRYRRQVMRCAKCGRIVRAKIPGVLDSCRYGNSVIAQAATDFFLHGITAGTIERRCGVPKGSLFAAFNRLGDILAPVKDKLLSIVSAAPFAQCDETGWRIDGRNGYAWTFISGNIVTFECADSRGSRVARKAIGDFEGILLTDRYGGYEYIPGQRAYCLEHLKRDALQMLVENPDSEECKKYVDAIVPILRSIMKLRPRFRDDPQTYRKEALKLAAELHAVTHSQARHPKIQIHQDVFRDKRLRTWQWLVGPEVPAENNRSEREVRPLTIAGKISHGSQSERGAKTRGVLMSVLHTLKACGADPCDRLRQALDAYSQGTSIDLFDSLFRDLDFAIPKLSRGPIKRLPESVTSTRQ